MDDYEGAMLDLIESGRSAYDSGQYRRAFKRFTRAMRKCPCNKGKNRPQCLCKDYDVVAQAEKDTEHSSIFKEAMFTCRCDVGRTFNKCDEQLHITALDYRAATHEALNDLSSAELDAKWMLELSPRLPDGYLRLGKIARFRKRAWFAWKVYCAGRHATKDAPASQKLQKLFDALQGLNMSFARKDPMGYPPEIIYQIFAHLSISCLTRCLNVSNNWNYQLTNGNCQKLWIDLVFPTPGRPLPIVAVKALVARSGKRVRKFVMEDTLHYQLAQSKLSIILGQARDLECLKLGPSFENYYLFPYKGQDLYSRLRYVSMDMYNCVEDQIRASSNMCSPIQGLAPHDFIKCIAGTLEHLDLHSIVPAWSQEHALPHFPNLKVLSLSNRDGVSQHSPFPIFLLATKTPKLEQLSLRNLHLEHHNARMWKNSWRDLWSELKVFLFTMPARGTRRMVMTTIASLHLVNSLLSLGKQIRYLVVDIENNYVHNLSRQLVFSEDELLHHGILEPDGTRIEFRGHFASLKTLWLRGFKILPEDMGLTLQASVLMQSLRSFDINFPPFGIGADPGRVCTRHLSQHDWLRGLPSIRCLGLWGFVPDDTSASNAEPPLLAFILSFPNLETLCLVSNHVKSTEFMALVGNILRRTRIKTLYQACHTGAVMDQLVEYGLAHNVDVIYGRHPTLEWPVRLED